MTERGSRDLHRSSHRLEVGPSALEWRDDALHINFNEWTAPLPSRLRGQITLRPAWVSEASFPLDPQESHWWRPIAPMARIEVECESPRMRWQGSAYWDSNWGEEPLESAFARWTWSRAHRTSDAIVHYDIDPIAAPSRTLSLRFTPEGAEPISTPPMQPLRRTFWGLPRAARWQGAPGQVVTLEDTPFYTRSAISGEDADEAVTAFHESLSLRRFRSPIVRAMLPFRMPRLAGRGPRLMP